MGLDPRFVCCVCARAQLRALWLSVSRGSHSVSQQQSQVANGAIKVAHAARTSERRRRRRTHFTKTEKRRKQIGSKFAEAIRVECCFRNYTSGVETQAAQVLASLAHRSRRGVKIMALPPLTLHTCGID